MRIYRLVKSDFEKVCASLINCLTMLVVDGIRYFEVGEDEERVVISRVASVLRGLGDYLRQLR